MPFVSNFDNTIVPNVYIREAEPAPTTTNTSIGVVGVVVQAIRGLVGVSTEVNSYADFVKKFGGYTTNLKTDHDFIYDLFAQNVARVKVVRVTDGTEKAATGVVGTGTTLRLTSPGSWGNSVTCAITATVSGYVTLTFAYGNETYTYENVTLTSSSDERYLQTVLDASGDDFIEIAVQGSTNPTSGTTVTFTGGTDGTLTGTSLTDTSYIGTETNGTGLYALGADKEVELVGGPRNTTTFNDAVKAHATNNDFSPRLGVVAPAQGTTVDSLVTTMVSTNSDKLVMTYPFVQVRSLFNNRKEYHSPVPFYLGLLSKLQYHESPLMQQLNGVIGLERSLTEGQLRTLTSNRVSPLVLEPGIGFVVRNGLTTSSNPAKQNITRRRAVNFFSKAFESDLRQFVGKPHTAQLRNDIKSVLGIRLSGEAGQNKIGNPNGGAPYGIKCDSQNNTADTIRANKVIVAVQISLLANGDIIQLTLDAAEAKTITIQ